MPVVSSSLLAAVSHFLLKCKILSLNTPVTDELLVIYLTVLFALCGISSLRVRGWGRLDQGKHVIGMPWGRKVRAQRFLRRKQP